MRYAGKIGFIKTVDRGNGLWEPEVVERTYIGDVIRNTARWQANNESTNDNIVINNQLSILVDPYALENFQYMKYIEWMGSLWNIESVEINYPRVVISIGGVYNGEQN